MKSKKNTYVNVDPQILGLPTVYIKLHGVFGFLFIIDTSVKHNLLDPCLMEFIIMRQPTEEELAEPNFFEDGSFNWNHRDPITPIHHDKGQKRVMCKDGIRRVCNLIKLDFIIESRGDSDKYSELFSIDPSLCRFFHSKKRKVIMGVLGNDFLKKHKWVLDYSK